MVAIINVSEDYGIPYGKGKQVYNVQVNRNLICIITHNFEDGLSALLKKASKAVEKAQKNNKE